MTGEHRQADDSSAPFASSSGGVAQSSVAADVVAVVLVRRSRASPVPCPLADDVAAAAERCPEERRRCPSPVTSLASSLEATATAGATKEDVGVAVVADASCALAAPVGAGSLVSVVAWAAVAVAGAATLVTDAVGLAVASAVVGRDATAPAVVAESPLTARVASDLVSVVCAAAVPATAADWSSAAPRVGRGSTSPALAPPWDVAADVAVVAVATAPRGEGVGAATVVARRCVVAVVVVDLAAVASIRWLARGGAATAAP